MVSTYQIKPALILQPFISCYSLRIFNTGEKVMPQPLHAIYEYFLTFFLKYKFCKVKDNSGKVETRSSSLVTCCILEKAGQTLLMKMDIMTRHILLGK